MTVHRRNSISRKTQTSTKHLTVFAFGACIGIPIFATPAKPDHFLHYLQVPTETISTETLPQPENATIPRQPPILKIAALTTSDSESSSENTTTTDKTTSAHTENTPATDQNSSSPKDQTASDRETNTNTTANTANPPSGSSSPQTEPRERLFFYRSDWQINFANLLNHLEHMPQVPVWLQLQTSVSPDTFAPPHTYGMWKSSASYMQVPASNNSLSP